MVKGRCTEMLGVMLWEMRNLPKYDPRNREHVKLSLKERFKTLWFDVWEADLMCMHATLEKQEKAKCNYCKGYGHLFGKCATWHRLRIYCVGDKAVDAIRSKKSRDRRQIRNGCKKRTLRRKVIV